MKWEQDLTRDIRTHSAYDDVCGPPWGYLTYELTDCNRVALEQRFLSIQDRCYAILEIGVHNNADKSMAEIFYKHKMDDCFYVGIDIKDKSYLNNPAKNIYTIMNDSGDYENNMQTIRALGIEKFDFIFIDGPHTVNQVLKDWEYTRMLSDHGIVGLHDTRVHPGVYRFITALNTAKWNVEENVCRYGDDWGIGFASKKL